MENRPRSSASPHIFIKAIEIIERDELANGGMERPYLEWPSTQTSWALRHAFFAEAQDISDWNIHKETANGLGIDYALVEEKLRSSEAVAQLVVDYELSQKHHVVGSPTFIMNEGRQKLFGNVGYECARGAAPRFRGCRKLVLGPVTVGPCSSSGSAH